MHDGDHARRVAGVDLATEASRTALAVLDEVGDERGVEVKVVELRVGVDDADILDVAGRCERVGLDCPIGWPEEFIAFVTAHASGSVDVPTDPGDPAGRALRRRLALRETDRDVHARTGLTPLSVSTDRIGLTAVRAAGLLATLAACGQPVDRSGAGVLAEVYPAACLKLWGLPHRGYKGATGAASRSSLLDALRRSAPWLRLGAADEELCRTDDNALDAVVAALAARAVALDLVRACPPAMLPRARREGWVLLPRGPLSALAPTAPRPSGLLGRGPDPAPPRPAAAASTPRPAG